ncbi:MAG TPA: hypothetical protein VJL10_09515 [Anaerolineales bacterium]|nr:hypothetical protein [Anaerolineales bacterium]
MFIGGWFFIGEKKMAGETSEYRALQLELVETPTKGKLIKGTGGARKQRFGIPGKGKSGSIRIIYYYQVDEKIYMLLCLACPLEPCKSGNRAVASPVVPQNRYSK